MISLIVKVGIGGNIVGLLTRKIMLLKKGFYDIFDQTINDQFFVQP